VTWFGLARTLPQPGRWLVPGGQGWRIGGEHWWWGLFLSLVDPAGVSYRKAWPGPIVSFLGWGGADAGIAGGSGVDWGASPAGGRGRVGRGASSACCYRWTYGFWLLEGARPRARRPRSLGPTSRVQARPRWMTCGGGERASEKAERRSVGMWRRFIEAPAFFPSVWNLCRDSRTAIH
jgi:hypothetical protein